MDSDGLLKHLPIPLVDEFKAGRWLPIIGAGLSLDAESPTPMPDWDRLGKVLDKDLPHGYRSGGAVETISAYEHAYGRTQLTARVATALHMTSAKPSPAQLALAALSFENVITTNVEHLLEDAYRQVRGPILTVIEDGQLRMANPYESPVLVKLHGDLHHPSTLVLTEDDYDRVHLTRPMMLTWLAGQLIQKTGILIGYSLGDPDVRAILTNLRNSAGAVPPDLWVLTVGDNVVAAERYRRRGVRVVSLPETERGWGILQDLFEELLSLSSETLPQNINGTTTVVDAALRVGQPVDTMVLFLVDPSRLPFYAEFVFPDIVRAGLTPISRADVRADSGFSVAVTDRLLRISGIVVVEADNQDDSLAKRADATSGATRTITVGTATSKKYELVAPQSDSPEAWIAFASRVVAEVGARRPTVASTEVVDLPGQTMRALIDLEGGIRGLYYDGLTPIEGTMRTQPLRALLYEALQDGVFEDVGIADIDRVVQTRNELAHGRRRDLSDEELAPVYQLTARLLSQVNEAVRMLELRPAHEAVYALLEQFGELAPNFPHLELANALMEAGYVPRPAPGPRRYIRWTREEPRKISIYQEESGLILDSRRVNPYVSDLPIGRQQGRRVYFDHSRASVQELKDLASKVASI